MPWFLDQGGEVHVILNPDADISWQRAALQERPNISVATQWESGMLPQGKHLNYDFYVGIVATVQRLSSIPTLIEVLHRVEANWLGVLIREAQLTELLASAEPPKAIALPKDPEDKSILCFWYYSNLWSGDPPTIQLLGKAE
jgi:hypothetical protein